MGTVHGMRQGPSPATRARSTGLAGLWIAGVLLVLVAGCSGPAAGPAWSGPPAVGASPVSTVAPEASPSPGQQVAGSPTVAPGPSEDPAARLATAVSALQRRVGSPGALGLLVDGSERAFSAAGHADLDGRAPIGPDTRFRIASITKPIVAALVLISVDRGELGLDSDIGDLLPGVLRPDPTVTVRQLLAHTSGVFDEGNEGDPMADLGLIRDAGLRADAEDLLARSRAGERIVVPDRLIVALAETHDRYFAPGEGYHYSNVNYQVAAMVLERVTGRSLADLLDERIVVPLGLTRTSLAPADPSLPDLLGYETLRDGSVVDVSGNLAWFGNGGNGGVISTAGELADILRAIVTGGLFDEALVREMEIPVRESYGLGLGTNDLACGRFFGHEGSVNGTRSIAMVSGDGSRAIVLAVNLDGIEPWLPAVAGGVLCHSR
jgi:D-alanyl-D-alanine carboxypeptidase